MTLSRPRLLAALAAVVLVLAALAVFLATPSAQAATSYSSGTLTAVPNLNRGETGTITVADDGTALRVSGSATGMQPGTMYVSLIYPDNGCAAPQPSATFTVADGWDVNGLGNRSYAQTYTGSAYQAVKGHIGSVSIRAITQAINTQAGGNFLLTAEARACADITPNR